MPVSLITALDAKRAFKRKFMNGAKPLPVKCDITTVGQCDPEAPMGERDDYCLAIMPLEMLPKRPKIPGTVKGVKVFKRLFAGDVPGKSQ